MAFRFFKQKKHKCNNKKTKWRFVFLSKKNTF